jgi:heptaprenyl diphosphate synthase
MNSKIRDITLISILVALATILNIIDSSLPLPLPMPVHLGLANIITILAISKFGAFRSFFLVIVRVVLAGLIRGTFLNPVFFQSLLGSLLAWGSMFIIIKIKFGGYVFASLVGAFFHSLGQVIVVMILTSTTETLYYFPVVLLLGIPTGLLTGFIAKETIRVLGQHHITFMLSFEKKVIEDTVEESTGSPSIDIEVNEKDEPKDR